MKLRMRKIELHLRKISRRRLQLFYISLNDKFINMYHIKNYALWVDDITCPAKTRTCLPG
jgi:hypothetical protein